MNGSCPNCGSARPNVLKVVRINGTGMMRYTLHCLNPSCGCTFDEMRRQAKAPKNPMLNYKKAQVE